MTKRQLLFQILFSAEFFKKMTENALEIHLNYIHWARIRLVSTVLPEAKNIVDLGGANGSIFDMGYPYKFDKLTIVDLPPEDRCLMYKNIEIKSNITPLGPVYVLFTNMTDLSAIDDNSVDFVWSGESIEHITEDDSKTVYTEVKRILKPGGFFCLDTPNRLLTEIHTEWNGGGYIHPEHKIEYYPKDLKKNLIDFGFSIVQELGVCEMTNTCKTRKFDYKDFVTGNALSSNLESSYIQFYKCKKI